MGAYDWTAGDQPAEGQPIRGKNRNLARVLRMRAARDPARATARAKKMYSVNFVIISEKCYT